MKLPEFITYCTLKDLIVVHERLDNEWYANATNMQKLVIENDNFLATIKYIHFANKYSILYSELSEYSPDMIHSLFTPT